MTIHDTAELVQSHMMVIFNQYYADYRLTGVPMRFLKQLIIATEPDDTLLAFGAISPGKWNTIHSQNSVVFNHFLTVLGQVVSAQSPPNAMASTEIGIMSRNLADTNIKVKSILNVLDKQYSLFIRRLNATIVPQPVAATEWIFTCARCTPMKRKITSRLNLLVIYNFISTCSKTAWLKRKFRLYKFQW